MTKEKKINTEFDFYDDYFLDFRQIMSSASTSSTSEEDEGNVADGGENVSSELADMQDDYSALSSASSSATALRFLDGPHPKTAFVTRAQPATLRCRAVNAKTLRFACNSKMLSDHRHEWSTGIDPESGATYLEAKATIVREDLDARVADLGELSCRCYASASASTFAVDSSNTVVAPLLNSIPSDAARLKLAYLRKHFYQMPASQRIAEGKTAQLQCVPPDADPKPEVTWRKDGELVMPNIDSNLIIANDGSLIISATRLTDSGNYTCEASNVANRRISDSAQVTVYVDGAWSPWSMWHGMCPQQPGTSASTAAEFAAECAVLSSHLAMTRGLPDAVQRVLPKQRRTRDCNNPAPLNGGANCVGDAEEFRLCKHQCKVDGEWSHWTMWSECDANCRRTRMRKCNAPPPTNNGLFCKGEDLEWRNCTVTAAGTSSTAGEADSPTKDDDVPPHCRNFRVISGLFPSFSNHSRTGPAAQAEEDSNVARKTMEPKVDSQSPKFSTFYLNRQSFADDTANPSNNNRALPGVYPPQMYVLASMGCVAFLLMVIAALIAALLYNNRRKRSVDVKSKGVDAAAVGVYVDSSGTKRKVFLDEKGEKIYFPLAVSENFNESDFPQPQQLRRLLLSEQHHRTLPSDYFGGGGTLPPSIVSTTRSSTPTNARVYRVARTANGGGEAMVRHTASAAGIPVSSAFLCRKPQKTRFNTATSATQQQMLSSDPYFVNQHFADSRAALIPSADYSASNLSSRSESGGGPSGDGLIRGGKHNSYQHHHHVPQGGDFVFTNPMADYYSSNSSNSCGSNLVHGSTGHRNTNANYGSHCDGSGDLDYATLYDYVISSTGGRNHLPTNTISGSTTNTTSGTGFRLPNDDSGNNSSESERRYPASECTAEFLDEELVLVVEEETPGGVKCDRKALRKAVVGSTSTAGESLALTSPAYDANNDDAPTIVAVQVNAECTRIELRRSGVALTIGDTTFIDERMIFLAVSDNAASRPTLRDDETWLSNIVVFGLCQGDGLVHSAGDDEETVALSSSTDCCLRRPVVLSFEHCASLFPKDNWQFVVYGDLSVAASKGIFDVSSSTESDNCSNWERLCCVGEENLNTSVYVHLERNRCHLMCETFGRFVLAGRPRRPKVAAQKRVHLAAYCSFGGGTDSGVENEATSIRVYVVPEMSMCIESVRKQEEDDHGGRLLAEAENFLMCASGELCCCLEEISGGYTATGGQYLEITESDHRWCVQNGIHFSVDLQKVKIGDEADASNVVDPELVLSGRIVLYQKGNPTERQLLSFHVDQSQLRKGDSNVYSKTLSSNASSSVSARDLIVSTRHCQLGANFKRQLCELLDTSAPPASSNNNVYGTTVVKSLNSAEAAPMAGWMELAKKLGFFKYIQYFGTHPGCSPTSLLFDLWEAISSGSERAVLDLLQALRVLGRVEAVAMLEKHVLQQHNGGGTIYASPPLPPHERHGGGSGGGRIVVAPLPSFLPPPPPPLNSANTSAANSSQAIKCML